MFNDDFIDERELQVIDIKKLNEIKRRDAKIKSIGKHWITFQDRRDLIEMVDALLDEIGGFERDCASLEANVNRLLDEMRD